MTEKEIQAIKSKDCTKCEYFSKGHGPNSSHCNYLEEVNQRRPCHPGECREKGVFKGKTRKRKVESKL